MTDFEDRLRRALAQSTRTVADAPDWDDLTDRLTKRDRTRTRWLALALVLALLAGPLAGFALGRRGAGDDTSAVRAVDDSVRDDGVVVGDAGPAPTIVTVPQDLDGGATRPLGPDLGGRQPIDVYHPIYLSSDPIAFLFARNVDDLRIRVYRAATPGGPYGPPWWEPPAWCFPSGYVQADVSTDAAVGFGHGATFDAVRDGAVAAELSWMGLAEGEPAWIVVAQAPAGAARVRATFPDGATDTMGVVDGIAVLYGRAPDGTSGEDLYQATVAVDALDASGAVVAEGNAAMASTVGTPEECVAPTDLPEPGPEQPAEVDAARAAVIAAYELAYDGSKTVEERGAAVADPSGWQDVQAEIDRQFPEQVAASRARVTEVVFVSATRAAVRFDIVQEGSLYLPGELGEAVLVNGRWKVTREAMCGLVTLAGKHCPSVD